MDALTTSSTIFNSPSKGGAGWGVVVLLTCVTDGAGRVAVVMLASLVVGYLIVALSDDLERVTPVEATRVGLSWWRGPPAG